MGTLVSTTIKAYHQDVTEILLNMALNAPKYQALYPSKYIFVIHRFRHNA
jgi:hypothetical protein